MLLASFRAVCVEAKTTFTFPSDLQIQKDGAVSCDIHWLLHKALWLFYSERESERGAVIERSKPFLLWCVCTKKKDRDTAKAVQQGKLNSASALPPELVKTLRTRRH